MGNYHRWLAMIRRVIKDPYMEYTSYITTLVPEPNINHPYVTIFVSTRSGNRKSMMRFSSLEDYETIYTLTDIERERLVTGLDAACKIADQLEQDIRLILRKRQMGEGSKWVQTDTGEIIAEAERIIKGEGDE